MVGCRQTTESHSKSVQQLSQQQKQKLVDAVDATTYDAQHPGIVVAPTSPPTHSESTLLLVARDAWTS